MTRKNFLQLYISKGNLLIDFLPEKLNLQAKKSILDQCSKFTFTIMEPI